MRNKLNPKKQNNYLVTRNIFIGSSLVVLVMVPSLMDPINVPKMVILFFLSIYSFSNLILNKKALRDLLKLNQIKLIILFLVTASVTSLLSNQKYKALLGETQRKNGFVTYLSLCVVAIALSQYFNSGYKKVFNSFVFITSIIFSGYGTMQVFHADFVEWSNPYNRVISTSGNPNFAASVLAIMFTLNALVLFDDSYSKSSKIFRILVMVDILFCIVVSNARQGVVLIFFGISLFMILYLFLIRSKIRFHILIIISILYGFSILGMLNQGPLAAILYKESVSIRGYYWKAALKMFFAHPFTGVGVDNYGDYFKQFRAPEYSNTYGFSIGSTSAHNVVLQFFATGGILLGFTYLFLIFAIFFTFKKVFKQVDLNTKYFVIGIFVAWMQYQAQSLISIDNITIAIWNWILIGLILALYRESNYLRSNNLNLVNQDTPSNYFMTSKILAFSLILACIWPVSKLIESERATLLARTYFDPKTTDAMVRTVFLENAKKAIKNPLCDPAYKYILGASLVDFKDPDGKIVLTDLRKNNPRNLDVQNFFAKYYENEGNINLAIDFREKVYQLDPYNGLNLLQLGLDYKSVGDNTNSEKFKALLLKLFPDSKEAQFALSNI